jgi:hypothetical protein
MTHQLRFTVIAALACGLGWAGLAFLSKEPEVTPIQPSASKSKQAKASPILSSGPSQDNSSSQAPESTGNTGTSPDPVSEAFVTARLQFLNEALTLSPEQAERARAILASYLPDRPALVRAAAAPPEDEAAAAHLLQGAAAMRQLRRHGPFADDISTILTPGQQALWQSSLQKMAQDDAEVVSSRELAAIQARTTLSEEQKNEIYTTLHRLALTEQTEPPVTLDEAGRDEFQIQRRMEALASLFPDETQSIIRRALDQAAAERWFLPLEPLEVFDNPEP